MPLETREVVLPEHAVFLGPCRDLMDSGWLELIDPLPAFPFFADEPGAPKNSKVP